MLWGYAVSMLQLGIGAWAHTFLLKLAQESNIENNPDPKLKLWKNTFENKDWFVFVAKFTNKLNFKGKY
jgi:hypothetical protein